MTKAKLVLSNGMILIGDHIGARVETSGELVFTTSMVGYPESLTDPSYCGQILTFCYPLIGNYGLPSVLNEAIPFHLKHGYESKKSWVSGVLVSNASDFVDHHDFEDQLDHWLKAEGIPGIVGLDTRELVKIIRSSKMLLGKIILEEKDHQFHHQFKLTDDFIDPNKMNLVNLVSTKTRTCLGNGKIKIGLIDFGVKWGIVNSLLELGCQVEIIPWDGNYFETKCDGYLLSNGPGDPEAVREVFPSVKKLIDSGNKILGICLGHQILALASGAKTMRLPFGHRGYNHPVVDVKTKLGFMTSQNHSYYVAEETLNLDEWDIWFVNANDGSIEGVTHKVRPVKGVQFHPEASGGPNDCKWILKDFVNSLL